MFTASDNFDLVARIEFIAGIRKLEAYLAKQAAFAAYLERTGRA